MSSVYRALEGARWLELNFCEYVAPVMGDISVKLSQKIAKNCSVILKSVGIFLQIHDF